MHASGPPRSIGATTRFLVVGATDPYAFTHHEPSAQVLGRGVHDRLVHGLNAILVVPRPGHH
jgi:hypothetical protein